MRRTKYEKHGKSHTLAYSSWEHMIARCYDPKNKYYHNYGGRGITVCERWKNSFANFYEDMGECPSKDHSLDRLDNDGTYCKENCKWSTRQEQGRNKRDNHLVTYKGETLTITEIAEKYGIDKRNLYSRINKLGWSINKTIETPIKIIKKRPLIKFNNEELTLSQWSIKLNVNRGTLKSRLKTMSVEEAFTIPVRKRENKSI